MIRVCSVAAARPNFVKLAAVHHALAARSDAFEHIIVHTGQHYDPLFSDIFFEQLSIPLPSHNLGIAGGTREEVIERTKAAFAAILPAMKPDIVLVYGDVNGAVGAAQAARDAGIRLAHVEAGLRSFDDSMPEEHNRIAIDQISDLLLCSEQSGMDNIMKEKISGEAHLVGNTMIDTLVRMLPLVEDAVLPFAVPDAYAVVTLHRPGNVDDKAALEKNLQFLGSIAAHLPLILPLHHRTKASLERFDLLEELPEHLIVCPPLGYVPFLKLVKGARFILTDSGGIQEEATYLKKRCFTLRKNTERPSTIESGSNVLIDIEKEKERTIVDAFVAHPADPQVNVPSLWDGQAGARIVALLP